MQLDFSVLMSVYIKEKPEYLQKALESICEQTCKPREIILIEDGPLTPELYRVLDNFNPIGIEFRRFSFKRNKGLAIALNAGVKKCKYEYIARMDSDDIAVDNRFEKQITYMLQHVEIAALGGQIDEFIEDPNAPIAKRNVPLTSDEIKRNIRLRNPMNHMTVMFKKSAVILSGGYPSIKNVEDYLLWCKMLSSGYKMANLSETLVKARVGNDMIGRRSGWTYFLNEMKIQKLLWSKGMTDPISYVIFTTTRGIARLMPKEMLSAIYKRLLHAKE